MARCTVCSSGPDATGALTYSQCALEDGHMNVVPVNDADGNIVSVVNIGQDHDYQPIDQATWETLTKAVS